MERRDNRKESDVKYKWADGYRAVKGVSAEKAAEELSNIAARADGHLTPERVLEAARDETSPLHGAFEWDDSEAAEQYRLIQARKLLQCVVVILDEAPMRPTRAFVSVVQDDFGPSYVGVMQAMSDEQMRAQVLGRAMHEAKAWAKRYQEYNELAEVIKAVDRTGKKIGRARKIDRGAA